MPRAMQSAASAPEAVPLLRAIKARPLSFITGFETEHHALRAISLSCS
jgi:hypothetical protein